MGGPMLDAALDRRADRRADVVARLRETRQKR